MTEHIFHVGTDVGGTFTDLWVADRSGAARVFKSPTTADVMTGVLDAVALAAQDFGLTIDAFCAGIQRFGHGTTVGLNALLTGNTARTGIITTRGFGDTLEIGRIRRQTSGLSEFEVTDFFLHNRFAPLVPRTRVMEVGERVNANGDILVPLDEAEVHAALGRLRALDIEALAICTLWSTANPVHERRIKAIAEAVLPDVFTSLSHEISPVVGEYGRLATTAANAALGPVAGRYLKKLEDALHGHGMRVPILMMTNAGGVLPTAILNDRPAYSLFSGPAAGVVGSMVLARKLGTPNVLTTDIGGTSFDVGVIIDGKPVSTSQISLAGADIRVPSIDVASIGAGGGSIATVRFGDLSVGPQSAGSNPGPACYGRGGTAATATDADLVLGVLDPENFIGGRMRLDVAAARKAIADNIAAPLGFSVEQAAWGIREILDSKMADLLRRVTIERGYDPATFTLLANGGAGPSHAWAIARELGLASFVVPAAATAQSAYGCGNGDLGLTEDAAIYIRVHPGDTPGPDALRLADEAMQGSARTVTDQLVAAGASGAISIARFAAVRFRGQTNTLDVPFEAESFDAEAYHAIVVAFEAAYEQLFGRGAGYRQAGFEILAIRTVGTGTLAPASGEPVGDPLAKEGSRPVIFDDPAQPFDTAIYRIAFPAPGSTAEGPCIIEFPGQSVVVPPAAIAEADAYGNLHVKLGALQ